MSAAQVKNVVTPTWNATEKSTGTPSPRSVIRPPRPPVAGGTRGVQRRLSRPVAAEATPIATQTSRQPGIPSTASPTIPETTRPALVPVLMIASVRGRAGGSTTTAARSEYAAHTQPAALPASTTPAASTSGDVEAAASAPPASPQALPTVVGARGPTRRPTTGASRRPARYPAKEPEAITPRRASDRPPSDSAGSARSEGSVSPKA